MQAVRSFNWGREELKPALLVTFHFHFHTLELFLRDRKADLQQGLFSFNFFLLETTGKQWETHGKESRILGTALGKESRSLEVAVIERRTNYIAMSRLKKKHNLVGWLEWSLHDLSMHQVRGSIPELLH